LAKLDKPVLVVGFESDKLYPINEQQELAELIPNSHFAALGSPYGHDAFLIEFDQLNTQLHSFFHSLTEVKS